MNPTSHLLQIDLEPNKQACLEEHESWAPFRVPKTNAGQELKEKMRTPAKPLPSCPVTLIEKGRRRTTE